MKESETDKLPSSGLKLGSEPLKGVQHRSAAGGDDDRKDSDGVDKGDTDGTDADKADSDTVDKKDKGDSDGRD